MTDVRRTTYPPAGHLVSVAFATRGRLINYGDLSRVISRWEETALISQAIKPYINRQRFVSLEVAGRWVEDLMTKQRKDQAAALADLLDWAATIEEGAVREHAPA